MSGVNGFGMRPIKVSEMRELIKSGQFANWIASIQRARKASIESSLHFMSADLMLKKIREKSGVDKNGKAQA